MHDSRKNIDIESLRAIAIAFVLAHHLFFFIRDYLAGFQLDFQLWQGVDLFFVISGYLITRLLSDIKLDFDQGLAWRNGLKVFWLRRAFRLLPAAWLWIFIPVMMAWIWPNHPLIGSFDAVLRDAIAAFTNTANFYWGSCIGTIHWGEFCSRPAVLGVFWSLSQEEQFYVLLPLLMVFLNRRAITLVLFSIVVLFLFLERPPLSLLWYTRPDGMIWGVLLAMHEDKLKGIVFFKHISLGLKKLVVFFLLIGLGVVPSISQNIDLPVSTVGLVSVISVVIVFLCIVGSPATPSGHTGRVLSWMGSRSYALYLAHWPIYCFIRIIFFPQVLSAETQFGVAFVFSMVWFVAILLFAELTL